MVGNYLIYILFTLAANGLGFVAAPIFSHYLSTRDFGLVGLFMVATQLFAPLVGLSMNTIISRSFYTRKDLDSLLGSAISLITLLGVVVAVVIAVIPSNVIAFTGMDRLLLFAAIIASYFTIISATFSSLVQMSEWPLRWGVGLLANSFTAIILSFLLIVLFKWGYVARIVGITIGQAVSSVVLFVFVRNAFKVKLKIELSHIGYFFKLGVPLLFFALSGWGLLSVDRICIQAILGVDCTGIYVFASTLASPVLVLQSAYTRVWSPNVYKKLACGSARSLSYQAGYSFLGYIAAGIILSTVGVYIYRFMISPNFFPSLNVLPWIVGGIVLQGVQGLTIPFILHRGKTKLLACASVLAFIINLSLNYYFIPMMGIKGAALATIISQAFVSLLYIFIVLKWCSPNINTVEASG